MHLLPIPSKSETFLPVVFVPFGVFSSASSRHWLVNYNMYIDDFMIVLGAPHEMTKGVSLAQDICNHIILIFTDLLVSQSYNTLVNLPSAIYPSGNSENIPDTYFLNVEISAVNVQQYLCCSLRWLF